MKFILMFFLITSTEYQMIDEAPKLYYNTLTECLDGEKYTKDIVQILEKRI